MADQELSADELAALKESREGSSALDADREVSIEDGREARESADAETKAALFQGKGVFSVLGEGRVSGEAFDIAEFATETRTILANKAIDTEFQKSAMVAAETYYVSCSAREVVMNSAKKQGTAIRKTDITAVVGTPGERTRFNSFNVHRTSAHYASGSHLDAKPAGPRIQGPAGGEGSCKFIIIQR